MTEELRSILGELQSRFQELYGDRLVQMVLYGSQARGDQEPGSDIDVLVVLRGAVSPAEEIRLTSDIIADTSLQHNVVISCVFVGDKDFAERNGPLLRNIRREGIGIPPLCPPASP